jgi:nicotinamide riboside kinase
MRIAILGAECTGKTALAHTLSQELVAQYPGTVWVPEYLREWCEVHGRTPRQQEQAAIAAEQMRRVQAHANAPLLLCDTTALITAIYSELLFGDDSLYAEALQHQRGFDLTLVTGLDLPWVSDGIQRDGPSARSRVDGHLRSVLQRHGIGYSSVYGSGPARSANALQTIRYALGTSRPTTAHSTWNWPCEKCSDPACEHRLFRDLLGNS